MNYPPEYENTVFHLESPPHPLPTEFAIITAHNPKDQSTDAAQNLAKDRELHECIEPLNVTYFRATGASPDGTHREAGWAAAISKDAAVQLGKSFHQTGIWWVSANQLTLITCEDGHEFPMRTFSDRIV